VLTLRSHPRAGGTLTRGRGHRRPAVTQEPGSRGASAGALRGHVLLLFQPVVGGVPAYVASLAEGLAEAGWDISAAAPSATPVLDRLGRVSRNVVALDTPRMPSPVHDLRVLRELAALCRDTRVDVIHAHSSKAGAIATVVGRLTGIPTVYTPHAWSFQRELSPRAERAYVAVERMLARWHAHVIVVANAERAEAEQRRIVAPERLELVNTGLRDRALPSREAARHELHVATDAFVIGWVGRNGPQKRPEHLPILARELACEATIVALGYGIPESEHGRELARFGGTVLAAVNPETVYAASDVLALTSRWEASPLVVLEAMRAGIPVVAYDIGGVRELLEDGETGYMVPTGDAEALSSRLRELARDPELASAMGLAGRARFLERFRFNHMIGGIERAYQQVLDARGAGGPTVGSRRP
jgi:glycosyltransferase involved in cell wall biosynthesis